MSELTNYISGIDLEKLLKETNANICIPKHDIKFEMNISGMSGDELAFALYAMSRIVKGASTGYKAIECDFEPPFLQTSITHKDGNDFTSISIITGTRPDEEDSGHWLINLSPEFCDIAESGEDIVEAIRDRDR